jgi:hypothetical protein
VTMVKIYFFPLQGQNKIRVLYIYVLHCLTLSNRGRSLLGCWLTCRSGHNLDPQTHKQKHTQKKAGEGRPFFFPNPCPRTDWFWALR